MRTHFTDAQLADPDLRQANDIFRSCVHCGFCLPTCPTYALLGDERDSPRGRIYLMQDMLESGGSPPPETVHHVDRCLSCLGCTTTCPSGVNYMHLVDQARSYIQRHHRRPWLQRIFRATIAFVLPRPRWFRLALLVSLPSRMLLPVFPPRLRRLIRSLPRRIESPSPVNTPQVFKAEGKRKRRVALLAGCVQQVLGAHINEATVRLLRRAGCEVVVSAGAECCGALAHHMGREDQARETAGRAIDAWKEQLDGQGLDAVVVNASGCGTTLKDYGHMFHRDPKRMEAAARIADISVDVTEILNELGIAGSLPSQAPVIAYHDACSLQHGQRLSALPRKLLAEMGFSVREIADGHMCCGAAGTYTLLQPELSDALGGRKGKSAMATGAAAVAAGNLGCMLQLERFSGLPAVHTVELLDWATGGPIPSSLGKTRTA